MGPSRRAVCAALLWGTFAARAAPVLDVVIVPQSSAGEIHRVWAPVLARVGEHAGVVLTLRSAKSIPQFEQIFSEGTPDLVFMNPYHAVMARRAAGYEPILCDASALLTGILVVRNDAPLQRVADLDGKLIAFPAPNSFGASLYMRALLSRQEKLRFQARYVNTHSNVFRQVLSGDVQAGGAVRQTLEQEAPQVRAQLRILYETPGVNSHPLAVHPRVSQALRARLREAFIALANDDAGRAMLRDIHISAPRLASYADYAPLERLGLETFQVQVQSGS